MKIEKVPPSNPRHSMGWSVAMGVGKGDNQYTPPPLRLDNVKYTKIKEKGKGKDIDVWKYLYIFHKNIILKAKWFDYIPTV
jgi:hypothetical protein